MIGSAQLFYRCTVSVLGRKAEFWFCPLLVFSACILLCVSTSFRHEVDETGAVLRHYAAYSGNSLTPFRDILSVPSSRWKSKKTSSLSSWISWPLKMASIDCSETSVRSYHYTLRNVAEERRSVFTRLRHWYKYLALTWIQPFWSASDL